VAEGAAEEDPHAVTDADAEAEALLAEEMVLDRLAEAVGVAVSEGTGPASATISVVDSARA
jgi:hypothetical protein